MVFKKMFKFSQVAIFVYTTSFCPFSTISNRYSFEENCKIIFFLFILIWKLKEVRKDRRNCASFSFSCLKGYRGKIQRYDTSMRIGVEERERERVCGVTSRLLGHKRVPSLFHLMARLISTGRIVVPLANGCYLYD